MSKFGFGFGLGMNKKSVTAQEKGLFREHIIDVGLDINLNVSKVLYSDLFLDEKIVAGIADIDIVVTEV